MKIKSRNSFIQVIIKNIEKTNMEISIKKESVFGLIYLLALVSVAVFAPFLKYQPVTGTIVNATLFISVMVLDIQSAIFVGLIPSLVSLAVGLLPTALAPMVPFIMFSNTILIVSFNLLRKRSYWLAVISSSLLKFLFLVVISSILFNNAVFMMSWPQLLTALAGGLVAYFIVKNKH